MDLLRQEIRGAGEACFIGFFDRWMFWTERVFGTDGRGYRGVLGGPKALVLEAATGFKSGEEAGTYPYTP